MCDTKLVTETFEIIFSMFNLQPNFVRKILEGCLIKSTAYVGEKSLLLQLLCPDTKIPLHFRIAIFCLYCTSWLTFSQSVINPLLKEPIVHGFNTRIHNNV